MPSFLVYNSSNEFNFTGKVPSNWKLNVLIKPSLFNPAYARAYVSESTWTTELYLPLSVSCSISSISVIVAPLDEMVNVAIYPSSPDPEYATN